MQQHQQQDHQEPFTLDRLTLPSFDQNPQADAPASDTRLEVYLDTISALMPSEVGAPALAEMRREMQDHLEATLTALQELGYTEDEAIEHAIAQFGEPRLVAKRWRVEWEETLARTERRPFWPSLKLALKAWSAMHLIGLISWLTAVTQVPYASTHSLWGILVVEALLCGPQIVTGMFLGIRARRRPILATFLGYVLSLPVVAVGLLIFMAVMRVWESTHNISGIGTSANPLLFKVCIGIYVYTLYTLPLGFACACLTALGQSVRQFARRRFASY